MIVEKSYVNQPVEESIDSMDVEDLLLIEELANKYGVKGCFDILNEKRAEKYYKDLGSSEFRRTGGYKQKGLGGVLQSIPSFAISAMISWPMTMLAALGALSVRIQKRWSDEDAWRNRLDPRFWADFTATPHGQSTPHEIAMFPVNAVKWTAGAAVAGAGLIAGSDKLKAAGAKLKGKAKEGFDTAKEKILGYKARTDSSLAADSSVESDEPTSEEMLTKAEVKNLDFRPYWLTFDNGEVVKVRADNAKNAEEFGKLIIQFLAASKFYEKMNALITNGSNPSPKYTFWFDDGQIAYMAKDTEKEATQQVLKDRANLCAALNRSDDISTKLDPMQTPSIIDRESQVGEQVVPMKRVKSVSAVPPKKRESKDKMPKPAYNYGKMKHYRCKFRNFEFNIAGYEKTDPVNVIIKLNKECVDEFNAIEKSMSVREPLFKIKFGDGDVYPVAAPDLNRAQKIANDIHKEKVKLMMHEMNPKEDIVVYEERWGKIANAIKSREHIEPPKNFTIKDDAVLGMVILKPGDEENVNFTPVSLK